MKRGRSFGPYGCLLFLMGVGFLIAGLASGMVQQALASVTSNAPDASESMKALGLWGLFTFGSLIIGMIGLDQFGWRNSTSGFGVILMVCGGIGLYTALTGDGTSDSGNVIWVVMNKVAEVTGSLMITSMATLGGGFLLVLLMMAMGPGKKGNNNSNQPVYRNNFPEAASKIPPGKGKACPHCGHMNANWCVSCERCGSMLPRAKSYEW
jgi:hypothetical protein